MLETASILNERSKSERGPRLPHQDPGIETEESVIVSSGAVSMATPEILHSQEDEGDRKWQRGMSCFTQQRRSLP
jgi:hypothetical protein